MLRMLRFGLVVLGGLVAASAAWAQSAYPDHPIRAIVPFPPGGGTDIFARLVAQNVGPVLGQPVVIENRGGADGNIGMEGVAKSKPDGYTMIFNSSAATVNPAMYRNLRFDATKELQAVAVICEYYNLIVVNPKVPANTLAEFVDLIRKNPGKYNVAAGGTRLPNDLFLVTNSLDMVVVPYRGGGDAITALLSGESHLMIVNAPGLVQHIASGKVRALATTAPARQPDVPNVPTTREAGMPDYTYGSFFGAYVPAGTPADVVRKLNEAINKVTMTPEVVERFRSLGAVAVQRTPEESNARYLGDIARLKDVVVKAKIPPLD